MKRLIETVKNWLRYDDIMAERGSDGGENDSNWDNAKVAMSRLVQEPLKVYVATVLSDIVNSGTEVETEVFADEGDAVDWLADKFIQRHDDLFGRKPDDGLITEFASYLDTAGRYALDTDNSSITYALDEKEVKNGSIDPAGECRGDRQKRHAQKERR